MNQSNTDTIHFFYFLSLKKAHTQGEGDKCASAPAEKKRENVRSGLTGIVPIEGLTPLRTPDPIDTFHV